MNKAVVFDMDGILFDTERLFMAGWQMAGKAQGMEISEELLFQILGTNAAETRAIMQQGMGDAFDYDRALEDTNSHAKAYMSRWGIPVKIGLYELLDDLDKKGYATAVATSSARPRMEYSLKDAGIMERFDVLISGDMIARGKPEPDIFLRACQELGVAPEDSFVLEDSKRGILASYRAGAKTIMVPDLLPPTQEERNMLYACVPSLLSAMAVIP